MTKGLKTEEEVKVVERSNKQWINVRNEFGLLGLGVL
jgi:hypothetical protein